MKKMASQSQAIQGERNLWVTGAIVSANTTGFEKFFTIPLMIPSMIFNKTKVIFIRVQSLKSINFQLTHSFLPSLRREEGFSGRMANNLMRIH